MVGLGEGGVGVLGLRTVVLELISDCVRAREGRFRLDNCMFSIVSLVTGLAELGRGRLEFWDCLPPSDSAGVGRGVSNWTMACFLLYR